MKTINKEVKANTQTAKKDNPFKPTTSGGGANLNMKVTIGADAQSEFNNLPRQVQVLLNYIFELGGTATLQQLNDFSGTAEAEFWGRGDELYNQSVSKITGHYLSRLTGADAWERKNLKGKAEIIKIVR
tara:strand:- start:135 stop:521 length:387 start_codon:yes stop_codon:yes gene_type:complete